MGGNGGGYSTRLSRRVLLGDGDTGYSVRVEIDREIGRSRRYGGRVSLCWIEIDTPAPSGVVPTELAAALREWDKSWTFDNDALILMPHTDAAGADAALDRLLALAGSDRIQIETRVATFPDDAPTANALISRLFESPIERSA